MNRIDFQLNRRVECLPYMWWSQQELLKKYRDWQVWHLPSNRYGSTRMDLVIPAKVGRLDKKELNAGQTIGVIDEKKTRLAPTGFIVRSINFSIWILEDLVVLSIFIIQTRSTLQTPWIKSNKNSIFFPFLPFSQRTKKERKSVGSFELGQQQQYSS